MRLRSYLGGQEHFYLETHCALIIPGENDEMTVRLLLLLLLPLLLLLLLLLLLSFLLLFFLLLLLLLLLPHTTYPPDAPIGIHQHSEPKQRAVDRGGGAAHSQEPRGGAYTALRIIVSYRIALYCIVLYIYICTYLSVWCVGEDQAHGRRVRRQGDAPLCCSTAGSGALPSRVQIRIHMHIYIYLHTYRGV